MKRLTMLAAMGLITAVVTLSAAPKRVSVTVHSDPEGATVYANTSHTLIGYAPITLTYPTSKNFQRGKTCDAMQPVMVRWASGVEASIDTLTLCPVNGATQQFTFERPDEDGRQIDVQFALEIAKVRAMQQMANAASEPDDVPPPIIYSAPPIRQRTHCYSYPIGNRIITNCS